MAKKKIKIADKITLNEIDEMVKNETYGLRTLRTLCEKKVSILQSQSLGDTENTHKVNLEKETKIYSSVDMISVSNCENADDHLVVIDDGVVEFSTGTISTVIITTVKEGL